MSRKRKLDKRKKDRRKQSAKTPVDRMADLVADTAAIFTCSMEIAGDFAYQCRSRCEDLETGLSFNRVAIDIWRDKPGQGPALADLLSALATERERHLAAISELGRGFAAMAAQNIHEHLDPPEKYQDQIRRELFPDLSPDN